MKILEQLDTSVTNLLRRLEDLQSENESLRNQVQTMQVTITALEDTTQRLTEALAQEDALRTKALTHIDRLLQTIQDFDGVRE